MHVVHSAKIKGAALGNGGLYNTADAGVGHKPLPQNTLSDSIASANAFASSGDIDDPSNLNGSPVYIQSGEHDTTVPPAVQEL